GGRGGGLGPAGRRSRDSAGESAARRRSLRALHTAGGGGGDRNLQLWHGRMRCFKRDFVAGFGGHEFRRDRDRQSIGLLVALDILQLKGESRIRASQVLNLKP